MGQPEFNVFLCHNSQDKAEVEKIREQLHQREIYAWLDKYDFEPFRPWQDQLEEIIGQIKAAAIFIGSSGVGPWADIEMKAFLVEFVERQLRMGLVILPSCKYTFNELKAQTPRFLRSFQWVDFRQKDPDPMKQLIWGITGIKPESQPIIQPPQPPIYSPKTMWFLGDFSSEKGIDYTELHQLLSEGEWEDANELTYQLMLNAVGKNRGDKLTKEDLQNFPCTDLKTIDKQWVKHSNGRFGFSIQKGIYLSVGGKPDGVFNQIRWKKFGHLVGWRDADGDYFFDASDDQHTFDISARKGHLPILIEHDNPGIVIDIFFRLETCIKSQFTQDPLKLLNSHLGYQPNTSANQAVKINSSLSNIQLPTQTDDLSSGRGIDYTRLRDLLAAHNWKEADQETYEVMIEAVGKKSGDWFTSNELLNFPCKDLRTINQLWVKYSKGRFGFSVQKEIYLSVGGKPNGKYDSDTYLKFCQEVGWIDQDNEWIGVKFSTSAPRGNLPSPLTHSVNLWCPSLASRLVKCNI